MTRLWMLQIGRSDSDDVTVYADQPGYPPISEGIARLYAADRVVFHGGIRFDLWAVERFYKGFIDAILPKLFDTVVVSRLLDPKERNNSLKDWGKRLERWRTNAQRDVAKGKITIEKMAEIKGLTVPQCRKWMDTVAFKGDYTGDFQQFDQELVDYAIQDIHVGRAVYNRIEPQVRGWGMSVWLEHMVAFIIVLQEQNGFLLDVAKARELEGELRQEVRNMEIELQKVFPPIQHEEWWTPKASNSKLGYVRGVPFLKKWVEVFNPGSRAQVAARLMAKYKWKPTKFTSSGAPQMDEAVLEELPWPEARVLRRYFDLEKRLGQISDGKSGWLKLVTKEGRVHGAVNSNGAATGRMSHFKPNMAQVNKKDLRMRACWIVRPGWKLVGCDAEGIEARMLGHYLEPFDGGAVIRMIVAGKKEDGTDLHSTNLKGLKVIGLVSRDGAKTTLYAIMYGAQDPKLGEGIKEDCRNHQAPVPKESNKSLGKKVREILAKTMVGIDRLTKDMGNRCKAARRHQIKGLDGRRVTLVSKHSALNYLLQGAGAIVMKLALVIFHFEVCKANGWVHGVDFGYCANVHDEVQIECRPEIAEALGQAFANCITEAGVRLKVRCPLAGSYSIGNNWKDTH
jgi:DNA polymerase-1